MKVFACFAAALAVAAAAAPVAAQTERPAGVTFEQRVDRGRTYQVVRVDLARAELRMYWKDEHGARIGSLAALDAWLRGRGETLLAAMNGGMFNRASPTPAGLYVERGGAPSPGLNRRRTPPAGELAGNFYALPNGVFFTDPEGSAHVVSADEAAALLPRMREATQSGPLLLRQGELHRLAGRPGVPRNAVAVCGPRDVALVLAPGGASLRELGLFIRDTLGCRDALYLDGGISGMRVPWAGVDRDGRYVAMIGVTAKQGGGRTDRR